MECRLYAIGADADGLTVFDYLRRRLGYSSTLLKKVKASGAECIFMTENAMNTHVSDLIGNERLRAIAEGAMKTQTSGMLEKYFEAAKKVALENGVRVCDCYAKWKAMIDAGVNVTELLSNKINHPIRELHYLFAFSLLETMFDLT